MFIWAPYFLILRNYLKPFMPTQIVCSTEAIFLIISIKESTNLLAILQLNLSVTFSHIRASMLLKEEAKMESSVTHPKRSRFLKKTEYDCLCKSTYQALISDIIRLKPLRQHLIMKLHGLPHLLPTTKCNYHN